MLLKGDVAIRAPRKKVWDFLTDPKQIAQCAPGVEKVEELEPLKRATNVQLLDGNGVLDGYIKYEVTAAHSPFHQVFWIEEDGKKIFFGADDAPQLQQMKNRFIAKYDYDGKKCMELRKQWWQQGQEEKWTFLFYHDIKSPVFEF